MLSVREITTNDIELLLDYWYSRSEYQLKIMGADIQKLPPRNIFKANLEKQLSQNYNEKENFACIWLDNNMPIGHNNINNINIGNEAVMHLHIWNSEKRKSGLGYRLLQLSIPIFFKLFKLDKIICEPYVLNPAPNKTLKKLGFRFEKKYSTIPGSINFKQEVNRWILTKEELKLKNWA
jgi:RimJ/RimL family protein N-acetyltransferase